MKKRAVFHLLAVSIFAISGCLSSPPAAKHDSLESVVCTLPPKYVAETPFELRKRLLSDLKSNEDTCRWDPANKWMNYFSDGGQTPPTSMIYLRVFAAVDGRDVVFVHMPKPFANGSQPSANQTFILRIGLDGKWQDVTHEVMPADADLTAHYSPAKIQPMVDVAPYERFQRADGKGAAYRFGQCTQELWWNGRKFELRNVPPRKLADLF